MATANGGNAQAEEALLQSRPPATDNFTYLTIIEKFLSPEILPTLNTVLQDASLTQEIGWDLVQNLVALPGSEPCLETIARLGNPREVIVKALEVLEGWPEDDEEEEELDGQEDDDGPAKGVKVEAESTRKFITLLGMLAILHRRIKTKYPSRFLASTLATVARAYRPNQEMTASVINLVQSLLGHRRPPLPTRTSSINIANLDKDGDTSRNAPDPEAEQQASHEETEIQERLLLSFVLGVLETYVNANSPSWAERLVETFNPKRLIPGKRTALQAFREEQELLARDTIVGQLAALARDLGLSQCSKAFLATVCREPIRVNTLPDADELKGPQDIPLPTGGAVCLLAYWAFSSTVFGANTTPKPDLHIFPDHFSLLQRYMDDDAQTQILETPGVVEAILALGLWLHHEGKVVVASPGAKGDFMPYHHLLTLCSVYHPSIQVRNATSILAGLVLHSDPDEEDRLQILEDLLENCMFAALKACAVTWLREELGAGAASLSRAGAPPQVPSVAGLGLSNVVVTPAADKKATVEEAQDPADKGKLLSTPAATPATKHTRSRSNSRNAGGVGVFASPDAVEQLQYWIFPDMQFLGEMDREAFAQYWVQNSPFIMQAANFAFFLFRSEANSRLFVPPGMEAAVEERYVRPLLSAVAASQEEGGEDKPHDHNHEESSDAQLAMELSILSARLKSLISAPSS